MLFWSKTHHLTIFPPRLLTCSHCSEREDNTHLSAEGPVLQGSVRDFLSGLVFQQPSLYGSVLYCWKKGCCLPTVSADRKVGLILLFPWWLAAAATAPPANSARCETIKHLRTTTAHSDKLPTTQVFMSCPCFERHFYDKQTGKLSIMNGTVGFITHTVCRT